MGRDHHHLEPVDLLKLERLRVRSSRHARQFPIQAEVILEGDGS